MSIVAALLITKERSSTQVLAFAPPAFFYIAAMYSSNMSLQFIDYPTQVRIFFLVVVVLPLVVFLIVGALACVAA
jgi:hypothetical protein